MQAITKPQIQKLHILFRSLDMLDDKPNIVLTFTKGRTKSTKDLTCDEAKRLIAKLCVFDPCETMKNAIQKLAYKCGIIYGSTEADKKINNAKLNLFCKERGAVKKNLHHQSYPELVQTHRQFEAIYRSMDKSQSKRQAEKAVSELLEELNLVTIS